MRMKLMMFLCMLALVACQNQQKPNKTFMVQADIVPIERKEPITIENLPGINAPVILDGDTVYTDVDTPPVFSAGDLAGYLQKAVKDVHIGKGISLVSFVVSKAGYPCHVFLRRSAGMRVTDARIAAQMDSIACDIVRNLPSFLPAMLNGELVNYRMAVAVKFE